jgi:outer membrane receptor protein involved in Fe transport
MMRPCCCRERASASYAAALFHELNVGLLYNYSTDRMFGRSLGVRHGFFSLFEVVWRSQQNYDYSPDLPGDNFWQFNLFTGYRFPRRAAELRVGVLNLTDQDYRLNPLNLHIDPPRERTFVISLRLNLEARL